MRRTTIDVSICFSEGSVTVIELEKPENTLTCLFEKLQDVNFFLREGKSGVHVVARHDREDEDEKETGQKDDTTEGTEKVLKQTFELYQLFYDSKKFPEHLTRKNFPGHLHFDLKKITDTSNITIFFGEKHHYLAVCSDDWDSLGGDCMYIEHKCAPPPGKDVGREYYYNKYYSISFAKMGGTKCQTVACDIAGEPPIWLAALAMWFQPSYV